MEERPEVPVNCLFQGCYNPAYEARIREGKALCHQYNQLCPNDLEEQREILAKLLGKMGREVVITSRRPSGATTATISRSETTSTPTTTWSSRTG